MGRLDAVAARTSRAAGGGMSEAINIRALAVGTRVKLANGAEAEIVTNPQDGVWLFVRFTASDDPAQVALEEMVFAQDVVSIVA